MQRPIALLVVVGALAGCGILPAALPDWVANRQPLPPCGEEDVGMGEDFDPGARRCLLDAFESGTAGELISTQTTVEGDPITRYVRVHDNGTIELFVDATRDAYGSQSWERLICDRLVPVDEAEGPGVSFPDEMVFIEEGCRELPVP
jgi:hypothetical protein